MDSNLQPIAEPSLAQPPSIPSSSAGSSFQIAQAIQESSPSSNLDTGALTTPPPPELPTPTPPSDNRKRWLRFGALGLAVVVGTVLVLLHQKAPASQPLASNVNTSYGSQTLPLNTIVNSTQGALATSGNVSINGQLNVSNALVLTPMVQPSNAVAGQLYYDTNTNQLAYFNGQSFARILSSADNVVKSINGLTGNVTTGAGLSVANNVMTNAGVLSLQGQTGSVTLTPGGGIAINGTAISNTGVLSVGGQTGSVDLGDGLAASGGKLQNTGVLSLGGQNGAIALGGGLSLAGNQLQNSGVLSITAGSNITVTDNGNGDFTISTTGGAGGSGGIGGGGTGGTLALWAGSGPAGNLTDSILSQSGATVTVAGTLAATNLSGDGSAVTGVNAAQLGGQAGSYYQNAGNISTGTLSDGRLSPNVALYNQAISNFLGTLQQNGSDVCTVAGNCTGVAGGSIGGSGTANKLALFTGSGYTVGNSILSQDAGATTVSVVGDLSVSGTVTATSLSGNGSSVTNVNAAQLGGQAGSYYQNAGNLNAGTLNDGRLSSNAALYNNALSNFTGVLQQSGYGVCTLAGNCVGNGAGGAIGGGGNVNQIALFTGTGYTIGNSILSQDAGATTVTVAGDLSVSGNVVATTLSGDGSAVTNVNAAELEGEGAAYYTNAGNLSAGTLADGRLSTNVGLYNNSTSNFTGQLQQNGADVCTTAGNCTGVSGGSIGGSGTANTIALFNGSGYTIGNSILAQSSDATSLSVTGDVHVTGGVIATTLSGDGSSVTNVNAAQLEGENASYYTNASNISTGTLADLRLSGNVALYGNTTSNFTGTLQHNGNDVCDTSGNCIGAGGGVTTSGGTANTFAIFTGSQAVGDSILSQDAGATTVTVAGDLSVSGSVSAASLSGNGSGVTNVNAAQLNGQAGSYYQNAGNLNAGTLNDGRLSTNVAQHNIDNNFTGALQQGGNDVCTVAGNCTGVAGGAIGGSGTANKIALFTGSGYTIGDSLLSQDAGATTVSVTGSLSVSGDITTTTGTVTAANFSGNGSSVTNVNAAQLEGEGASYYTDAGNISSGTLNDGRLSANVAKYGDTTANFTGALQQGGSDVCTTAGNCVGGGSAGSAIGGSGTANTIAMFTASGTIGDSLLSQDAGATTVSVMGALSVSGDITTTGTVSGGTLYQNGNQVCDESGNCAGTGGGVTTSGGTANTFAIFTGSQTIGNSLLAQDAGATTVTVTGSLSVSGNITTTTGTVTAANLAGNGSGVTNVNAAQLGGNASSYYTNASNLSSGTLNDGRLSTNVAKYGDTTSNFTGDLQHNGNDVCDASGNCASTGGGVTDGGTAGTANTFAIFTGAQTIGNSILSQDAGASTVSVAGNLTATGTITAASFSGDGASITNVNAAQLNGQAGSYYQDATNINAGTLSNSRLTGAGTLTVSAGNGLSGGGSVALGGSTALAVQAASGGCITVATAGISVTDACVNAATLGGHAASYFQPAGSYLTSESDTLATVTARGATTATASSFTGGLSVSSGFSASGIITLGSLSSAGVVHTNASGQLSTSLVSGTDIASGTITGTNIAANAVALGTQTTGNYVAGATAGSGIAVTGTAGEGWSPTIAVDSTVCRTTNNCSASGTAGGDLSGTYPNPQIAKLQGKSITLTSLVANQLLVYNGTAWVNALLNNNNLASGSYGNITGTGALTSGSIASGFGTISTSNNINTTAAVQGGTVNATTALQTASVTRIDASGNLTNINTITASSNASIGGNLSVGKTYAIGDTGPAGGIIFYDKGDNSGGWRYLEAAPSDQSTGVAWCSAWTNVGTTDTVVGSGKTNTATIIGSSCSAGAAKAAANYTGGGYTDWFLPSKDELNQLYTEESVIGGFAASDYWSSSQANGQQAWKQAFGSGAQQMFNQTYAFHVRAIREVPAATVSVAVAGTITATGDISTAGTLTVTGSGNSAFTGTVSGADATANNQFVTLAQLTSAVGGVGGGSAIGGSGTTNTIALFTASGTIGNSLLTQDSGATTVTVTGDLAVTGDITTATGTVTAANFSGDGSGVTNVNATELNGNDSSYYTNAGNLSSGTLSNSRLNTDVATYDNTTSNFTGALQQSGNDVCTTAGNCVGGGGAGSAIGGSGTTNTIALFTAAGTIGNSILTQTGTTSITVTGNTTVTGTLTVQGVGTSAFTGTVSGADATSNNQFVTLQQLTSAVGGVGGGVTTVGTYSTTNTAAGGATISGNTITFQSASINAPGMVDTTTQSFAGNKTFTGSTTLSNTTLAAGASITITGGNTASRPASPSAGMLYYDSTTNQLLQYNGSKWVSSPRTSTVIVAASNSTQAEKDAADYVATGTNDGLTINAALNALPSGGGNVYLMEGTYTLGATSVAVPDNTTLSGAGAATTLTYPNGMANATYYAITNSDTSAATHVNISNLMINGNKSGQTTGSFYGIYFNGVGGGSGSTARDGGKLTNVIVKNLYSNSVAIYIYNSSNNTLTGNTVLANNGVGISIHSYVGNSNNNTLIGNTVQGNGGNGIVLTGNVTVSGNTITGNTVQGNAGDGIEAQNSSNNTITGNTVQGNTGAGIHLYESSNNTVTGNTVQGNTSYGIYLQAYVSSTGYNNVTSNKIHDNGGSTTNDGIYLNGSASGYETGDSITGNDITDTSCSSNCYAININNNLVKNTYIANNHFVGDGTRTASIYDVGIGTIYSNQQDANGNLINKSAGGGFTIGTSSVNGTLSLQGGITATALSSPAAPTLATAGTAGTTSYTYAVTALDGTGETLASTTTTIATGNATLSGTNYIKVTFGPVSGATSYKIYRTASGGTPATTGYIGTVTSTGATSYTLNDTGLAASGSTPGANTTGGGTFAGVLQGGNATFTGGSLLLGTASTSNGSITLYSSAASGSVTLNLQNPGSNNYTLSIPTLTGNDTICTVTKNNCVGQGITTVGSFSGTSIANGASISGNTITFGPADATNPGMVTTGVQAFGGNKTFNGTTSLNTTTIANNQSFTAGGAALFKDATNSTSAFSIQNASSNPTFTVDTVDQFVGINTAGPSASLDVRASGGTFFDGFESGSISPLTTATPSQWAATNVAPVYSGSYSLRGNGGSQGTTYTVSQTVTLAATGSISFYYNCSWSYQESFWFKIDGTANQITSGCTSTSYNSNWQQASFTGISAGTHTLSWYYSGGPGSSMTNVQYNIDNLVITNASATGTAALFNGGNVGIGNFAPSALLSVGSSSQFQVDTNGNIVVQGTASISGTATLSTGLLGPNGAYLDGSGQFSGASISSSSSYWINGTQGTTTTCSGGQFLQNQVVQGGIVTGGTCASAAAGVTGSGTTGTIAMFSGSGTNLGNSILTQSGTSSISVGGDLSVSGTISTSATGKTALTATGAPAASATSSLVRVGSAIQGGNANGTYLSVNTASGFNGDLINLERSGSSIFQVNAPGGLGQVNVNGGVYLEGILQADGGAELNGELDINIPPSADSTVSLLNIGYIQGGNANGTYLGINAASSYTGDFLNFQINGLSKLKVDASGNITIAGTVNATSGYKFNGTVGVTTTCSGGQFLQNQVVQGGIVTGGTCASVTSGVTTVGALDGGTANANGATISGSTIYLQSASTSYAGLVNTGTQTFKGAKTFNDGVTLNNSPVINGGVTISGNSSTSGSFSFGSTIDVTGTATLIGAANLNGLTTLDNIGGPTLVVQTTPVASATSSVIQIGSAIQGGSASGTYIGLNPASSYAGDFLNFEKAGSSKFKVDASGDLTVGGALSVASTIYSSSTVSASGYYAGIAQGATTTCSSGQFLQNQVVQGGIVTGGTCASAGTVTGSGTSGTIALFSGSGTNLGNSILTQTGTSSITVGGDLSATGTVSTSATGKTALIVSGAPAASATSSLIQVGSAIQGGNANGTYLGLNASSSYAGDFLNFEKNGSSKFRIDSSGNVNSGSLTLNDSSSLYTTLSTTGIEYGNTGETFTIQGMAPVIVKSEFNQTAFQVQDASATPLLTVDTSHGTLEFDSNTTAHSTYYDFSIGDTPWPGVTASNSTTAFLAENDGSGEALLLYANGGNLIEAQNMGSTFDQLLVSGTGATTLRNSTNSTAAFQVQNTSGGAVFVTDTSSNKASVSGVLNINQVSAAAAPTPAIGAAGSLTGTYYYAITFVTASGQSNILSKAGPVSPSAQQVNLTNIPTGPAGLVTARNIYRSTGYYNTFYLVGTLNNNTSTTFTDNNTSPGAAAPNINTTGYLSQNGQSLLISDGTTYNTFVGTAQSGSPYLGVTGQSNTSLGTAALDQLQSGSDNTGIGAEALFSTTSGEQDTAVGSSAMLSNTTGSYNVALGNNALLKNTTGNNNVAIGSGAMYNNLTGGGNTGVGTGVLTNVTGSWNTALGYEAGNGVSGNSNVSYNTLMGYQAGYSMQTGADYNTLIGFNAGQNITTGANNIMIGSNINANSATASNQLNIGNVITGNLSAGTISFGNVSSGNYITVSSTGLTAYGTARHTRSLSFSPEYTNAVLDGTNCTGTANGTMTSGFDGTNNYYQWANTQSTSQCYDIVVETTLPKDFDSWATGDTMSTWSSAFGAGQVKFTMKNAAGTADANLNAVDISPSSSSAWNTATLTTPAGSYSAGQKIHLIIHLTAPQNVNVRVGDIQLNYYSEF